MYHCHLQFYLLGRSCGVFDLVKKMPPLQNFTHAFSESDRPEKKMVAGADVILVNLEDLNQKETVQSLVLEKRREADLILLMDQKAPDSFSGAMESKIYGSDRCQGKKRVFAFCGGRNRVK